MTDLLLESVNLDAYINSALIIGLLGVGALIKHLKVAESISNRLIPAILAILAILFCVSCGDNSSAASVANNILSGIINAASAVGTHQLGKNIFLQKTPISDSSEEL